MYTLLSIFGKMTPMSNEEEESVSKPIGPYENRTKA